MQLHDCMERWRMFRHFDPHHQIQGFEQQASELKDLLERNPFFTRLPESFAKKLLNGERSCMLTQDEILERMGEESPQTTRGYYRFLSSHAHSFPLAFYRMAEHNRGRGEENHVEKGYMASTLEFCADVVTTSTDAFRASFAGISSFPPAKFDWNVLISGRASRGKNDPDHG